ncbi:MAG TPA: DNA-binding response regulator [Gammaproteobacteria bacterium]|nr:DNA-binding response regulator [Gammaproteobacteria bacterium]HCO59548.1 DNA-binding response regulator [Porticoccaceae bacterium]
MHTVLIADDHTLIRESLRNMLEPLDDFSIVADVANGFDALVAVKKWKPSVLLLDVAMPDATGIEVVVDTQRWSPQTKIIIYTGVTSGAPLQQLIDSGIHGLLFKDSDSAHLIKALREVTHNHSYFDDKLSSVLAEQEAVGNLTEREKQVLSQILAGKTNRDIALLLNISIKTVDNHRTRLMNKLGAHSVSDLLRIAIKTGFIHPDTL